MNEDSQIHFALVAHVEGLHFQPHKPEGIEFVPSCDCDLRFLLKPRDSAEDGSGHRMGLECKVYATYPAASEQADFVDAYNNQLMVRVADGTKLPLLSRGGETLIAVDGSFEKNYHPPRCLCPEDILELIRRAEGELSLKVDRLLKLLRWRQGIDAPGEMIAHRCLYWKVAEGDYPIAPLDGGNSREFEVPAMFGIHWGEQNKDELDELWCASDQMEPLGHALLREAATLYTDSPRSSILIMTAALETATKMHISHIAPDTSWLMEEVASPPIFKILRDYIPKLHTSKGRNMDFWNEIKPLIKKSQKLVEIRNKVAHTGRIPDDAGQIQDHLGVVADLLYILDVLAGHEWAKSLVSHSLRKSLDWPPPKEGRMTVKIKVG